MVYKPLDLKKIVLSSSCYCYGCYCLLLLIHRPVGFVNLPVPSREKNYQHLVNNNITYSYPNAAMNLLLLGQAVGM